MSLDMPASGTALWAIYDATGLRPEWILPALAKESSLVPSAVNPSSGAVGLNQFMPSYIAAQGITPAAYAALPASVQLSQYIAPWIAFLVKTAAPTTLRSATRFYQANFLPATLDKTKSVYAPNLSSVIATKPAGGCTAANQNTSVYCANAGLDVNGSGTVTVSDIATIMSQLAKRSDVAAALAATYALRPTETMQDPVYGQDFSTSPTLAPTSDTTEILVATGAGLALLAAAVGAAYLIKRHHREQADAVAEENPTKKKAFKRCKGSSQMQSLLFPRDLGWTAKKAQAWAKKHDKKYGGDALDDKEPGYVRLRQIDPKGFKKFVNVPMPHTNGIRMVLGWKVC